MSEKSEEFQRLLDGEILHITDDNLDGLIMRISRHDVDSYEFSVSGMTKGELIEMMLLVSSD